MSAAIVGAVLLAYILGLILLRRAGHGLLFYLWGTFGLTLTGVLLAQFAQWNMALGQLEAGMIIFGAQAVGLDVQPFGMDGMLVPDPGGWSALTVGIECSTLVEIFTLIGLLAFYPRIPPAGRAARIALGVAATYLLNLGRLAIIILMIYFLGKPAAPYAHAVVGRLFFFIGVIWLYWRLLTLPTLTTIRRDLEVTGRAVT